MSKTAPSGITCQDGGAAWIDAFPCFNEAAGGQLSNDLLTMRLLRHPKARLAVLGMLGLALLVGAFGVMGVATGGRWWYIAAGLLAFGSLTAFNVGLVWVLLRLKSAHTSDMANLRRIARGSLDGNQLERTVTQARQAAIDEVERVDSLMQARLDVVERTAQGALEDLRRVLAETEEALETERERKIAEDDHFRPVAIDRLEPESAMTRRESSDLSDVEGRQYSLADDDAVQTDAAPSDSLAPAGAFVSPTTTDADAATNIAWNRERWDQRTGWLGVDQYGYRWGKGVQQTAPGVSRFADSNLAPFLEGRYDLKILELSPGAGRFSVELIRYASEMCLVDLSSSAIEICKERLQYYPTPVSYFVNDGRSLACVPDDDFDLIACFDSMVHMHPEVIHQYVRLARTRGAGVARPQWQGAARYRPPNGNDGGAHG